MTSTTRRSRTVSPPDPWTASHARVHAALTKKAKIKGQEYYLKLVDTAGQDEYSIFPAQYTMDVDGFCLVYRSVLCVYRVPTHALLSINNQKSFEVVKILYDKLLDLTGKVQ